MAKNLYKLNISLITILLCLLISVPLNVFSQITPSNYPKITGYVGILHPIISLSSSGIHTNFKDDYIMGLPTGINIWKTSRIGFSFEIVPFIKAENGYSKMNNLLFHPGILIKLANGFNFAGRVAFETNGRYGITPVFSKVVKHNKNCNYFIAIPVPVRTGNQKPSSIGAGFLFGIAF